VTGAADSSGVITNAAKVIAAMRPGFRQCYQRFLNRVPTASGRVRLAIHVNCSGEIPSVRATAYGIDRETVACMLVTIAQARFDPPEGGASVVNVPVTFVREQQAN